MVIAAVAWLTFPIVIDSMIGILVASVCAVVVGAILTIKVPSNAIGALSLAAGSAFVLYLFGRGYATPPSNRAIPCHWHISSVGSDRGPAHCS